MRYFLNRDSVGREGLSTDDILDISPDRLVQADLRRPPWPIPVAAEDADPVFLKLSQVSY